MSICVLLEWMSILRISMFAVTLQTTNNGVCVSFQSRILTSPRLPINLSPPPFCKLMPKWCYKWCLKISPCRPASAVWRPIRCSPHTSVSRTHLREISNQPFSSQHLYKEHNISPIQPLVMSGHTLCTLLCWKRYCYVDSNFTYLISVVARHLHTGSLCVITTALERCTWKRPLVHAVAALQALVQSNVSMHALPHDPSFIILTLATFLKWRKMLQSALPLVSEKMCANECVCARFPTACGRYRRRMCVCMSACLV